jgi:uncharacterized membrane protein
MIPRVYIVIPCVLVAASFVASAVLYGSIPDPAPVHWNMHGQADGFGPRWVDAFLFPVIMAALLGLLLVVPLASRWRQNIERFSRTYGRIVVTVVTGLVVIHLIVLMKAAGKPLAIERVLPVVVGVLIAVLGNWMGKVRRNSLVGIRTPWTLASDLVWEKTHRVGAKWMVAYGLVVAASAMVVPGWVNVIIVVGGALGLVVWAIVYSWAVARRVRVDGASVR